MKKSILLAGIALFLTLFLTLPSIMATSVELIWDSHDAEISVTVHRYRPSSTSGWATEEFAVLEHEAEYSTGAISAWIDFSCNIEGLVSAENGNLYVASIIDQDYGSYFKGFRVAEVSINSEEDFEALFSAHTFTMRTHLDNTWTLDAWLSAEGSGMSVHALRLYQKTKSDGTLLGEYYALIDAVLEGDGEAFLGSGWFPDKRNDVWWGNETLAFQLTADDISAYIESVDFPIINIYMDVDELIGEVVRPR